MTNVPDHVSVLVVGGGPSGLAAAIELGRRNVEVLVVEPRATLDRLRARAKTTSVRTMEHLRRWGIADELRRAAPIPVSHAQDVVFCTSLVGAEITRFPNAFGLVTEQVEDFAESGQQAPQPIVEQVLRDAAGQLPSVTMLIGWKALQVEDAASLASAVLLDPDGNSHTVTADWVLGCDGSSGISRAAIGAQYEGSSGSLPNLSVTFRSHDLDQLDLGAEAIHYWVVGAVGGLMGRLDLEGTWWAIIHGVNDPDDAPDLVRALIGEAVDVEVLATDPWQARMLLVDKYRGQRTFLVGDAAHLNPPWGGHGFNTCLGDAVNIGWKLAGVLQGWAPIAILDSYGHERRPVAARTVDAAADQEQFLAPGLAQPGLDDDGPAGRATRSAVGTHIQEAKDAEFHSLGLVLGYDYRHSPIVVEEGERNLPPAQVTTFVPSAHAGARLPHMWLEDGSSLYDHLGDVFTLLRFSVKSPVEAFTTRAAEHGVPLKVLDLPRSAAGPYGAEMVLVRPDQHVAWRGDASADPTTIWQRVLGLPVTVLAGVTAKDA